MIIGLDIGVRSIAWAVLGDDLSLFETRHVVFNTLHLHNIQSAVSLLLCKYSPMLVSIEEAFGDFKRTGTLEMALMNRVIGAIMVACEDKNVLWVTVTPTESKGIYYYTKEKEDVKKKAGFIYGINPDDYTDHEMDAIFHAIAGMRKLKDSDRFRTMLRRRK